MSAKPRVGERQMRLLTGPRRPWSLDARTRRIGRRGVEEAREILRRARPPEPARHPLAG